MDAGWHGRVTVGTSDTPECIYQPTQTGCPRYVKSIVIIAHEDNRGNVVVGPADDVRAAASRRTGYWELDAGQSMELEATDGDMIDLNGWLVDAATSNDSIRWVVAPGVRAIAEDITV